MHKLVEYICDDLEELERKVERGGNLSMSEIQYMDILARTKKNLLKSDEMGGYGMERYPYDSRIYSMARGGRGRGSNSSRESRDSRGRYSSNRYSYDDGYSMEGDFQTDLEELMREAPNEQIKQKLQAIMAEM